MDEAEMDLRQIRHFLTVADELHFGRAADRLNMTQPPLSMSIRRLEEDLGVQLFHRTTKSVALTTTGIILRRHAAQVLSDFDRLPTIARQAARGELGTLRLSFMSIASFDLLPRLVSQFRQAFPQVQIDLQEATSDVQLEALAEGNIDAGIIIRPSAALHPQICSRTLRQDPLVAAVSDRWAPPSSLASGTLDFRSIADAPLIFFPRPFAPAYYDAVEAHFGDGEPPVLRLLPVDGLHLRREVRAPAERFAGAAKIRDDQRHAPASDALRQLRQGIGHRIRVGMRLRGAAALDPAAKLRLPHQDMLHAVALERALRPFIGALVEVDPDLLLLERPVEQLQNGHLARRGAAEAPGPMSERHGHAACPSACCACPLRTSSRAAS
ncbi:LysR family transcriptional regulator [Ferrimonas balearica]|nr:LysR family transcriptional regulator [Ferrimonas balearica]